MLLDANDLRRYVMDQGIAAELLILDGETPTVADAAAVLGVREEQIVKSLLFLANGAPRLIIANGTTRVSYKRLADYLSLSRRRVKLASAEQVAAISGYPVGTVPPFGHRQPLPVILEAGVREQAEVYGGGGAINALLRIAVPELLRVVGEETAVLAE